jgi:predicted RecB family nuclease
MGTWPCYVGFTVSQKAFKREMERICPKQEVPFLGSSRANATTHFLTKDGATTAIIAMMSPKRAKVSFEQYAALVAHEAVHVAQQIWLDIGEKEPGKEAEAYFVQHIVQFCLQEAYKTGRCRRLIPA